MPVAHKNSARAPQFGRSIALTAALALIVAVAGCSGVSREYKYPTDIPGSDSHDPFGETPESPGIDIGRIGLPGSDDQPSGGTGVGVNGYLWRASLDTVSFMPLSSADPFGGVIITDWYAPPQTPTERFKLTVYILDTRLRADGVKVSVFRQEQTRGAWQDAAVDPATATKVENAILTRARELRLSSETQ